MLVVTHEMSFARDVSNRVFYMDEGGIYEDGNSNEIFVNPKKPKTQAFIYHIRTYNYEITSTHFDFAEMLGGLENFCFRHAIARNITNKLQLLAEELVINIITPKYNSCSLSVNYSEKLASHELSVSYGGESSNVLDRPENELAASMVKNIAKTLSHTYADGKNIITIAL